MREVIRKSEDVLKMLDELLSERASFNWDRFYEERDREVPFFVNVPDENLVSYFDHEVFTTGRVLELGCGPGRNAIYFAEKGCRVDAVDLSETSIQWAKERADERNINIRFMNENLFELEIEKGAYDIVYDSGCFHHIAPHRRMSYLNTVTSALKHGGYFALTCFVPGGERGGSTQSDWDVYRSMSLEGGIGYTAEELETIFNEFQVVEIREMKEVDPADGMFGVKGLLTALFKK